jgi:hypothetical protein
VPSKGPLLALGIMSIVSKSRDIWLGFRCKSMQHKQRETDQLIYEIAENL